MKKVIFCLFAIAVFFLTGCQEMTDQRDISGQRVVTILVSTDSPAGQLRRCYTSPDSIHKLLHCLRSAKSAGHTGKNYVHLTMTCANGRKRHTFSQDADGRILDVLWEDPGVPLPFCVAAPPLPYHPCKRTLFPALARFQLPQK